MSMNKRVVMTCLIIVCVLGLSACGKKVADEEKIQNDLELSTQLDILEEGELIDGIEILQRKTDKDLKRDVVQCKINTNDSENAYEKYYLIEYRLYDDGWVLENAEKDKEDTWSSSPLVGVKDDMAKEAIIGNTFTVLDENWSIEADEIGAVEVKEHNTKLEEKQDTIIASVELFSGALAAKGEVQIDYTYNQGWSFEKLEVVTPFEVDYRDGKALQITEDELIKIMEDTSLIFREGEREEQTVKITKAEIANFTFENRGITDKGFSESCQCTFDLCKSGATLYVEALLEYRYDEMNGWEVKAVTYPVINVKEADFDTLKGTWEGQMSDFDSSSKYDMPSITLEITEITDENHVTAIVDVFNENRSCYLEGTIDPTNFTFTLNFKEWIKKPKMAAPYIYEPKLCGAILIEDASIQCIKHSDTHYFKITKKAE